jgi:hypothetical protein
MNGKVLLSYLHRAEPLSLADVRADLSDVSYRARADEIVLWEHQLDWLAKQVRVQGVRRSIALESPRVHFASDEPIPAELGCKTIETIEQGPPARIFGVPVRIES